MNLKTALVVITMTGVGQVFADSFLEMQLGYAAGTTPVSDSGQTFGGWFNPQHREGKIRAGSGQGGITFTIGGQADIMPELMGPIQKGMAYAAGPGQGGILLASYDQADLTARLMGPVHKGMTSTGPGQEGIFITIGGRTDFTADLMDAARVMDSGMVSALRVTGVDRKAKEAMGMRNAETTRKIWFEAGLNQVLGLETEGLGSETLTLGSYAEIFGSYVGPNTSMSIKRGLNAPHTNGGIRYAPLWK